MDNTPEPDLTHTDSDLEDFLEDKPRDGSTLIRRRAGRLDLETFAPLFAQALHVYKGDATKLCMQEDPILLDNIEPEKAQAMLEALLAHGEDGFIIPAAELVPLPRRKPVHALKLTQEEIGFVDSAGGVESVPWGQAIVLVAGHVPFTTTDRKAVVGFGLLGRKLNYGAAAAGLGGGAAVLLQNAIDGGAPVQTVTSASSAHTWVDLVFLKPVRRFRIDGREFDYSLLGDQRRPGSEANILTLLRWLLHYLPPVRNNFGAEQLKHTGRTVLPTCSDHGFNHTVRWLINLVRHDHPKA